VSELASKLSVLVCVHNEEGRIGACLERLAFADEIVVVLDKCTDGTKAIVEGFGARTVEGAWDVEGNRRNLGIEACAGDWIFEVDADERVPEALAREILDVVATTTADWHEIPVDNYIGDRLVRWGWGASFGKAAYPGLFRKGVKTWGPQRVHPSLIWRGRKGTMLKNRLDHYVDRDISDMLRRLDNYSTAKAKDLRDAGETWGSTPNNIGRLFRRFFKCYVSRKGYREGGYGLLIAMFAGLYPLVSHLKAKLEQD